MDIGFLIDMDGVIYKGKELIKGADLFIKKLQEKKIPFLFITNNSQRSRRDVKLKLSKMGIDVTESNVFTCATATARFLAKQKPNGSAYVIGDSGLMNALHDNNIANSDSDPDYVIVGEGTSFNMNMIEAATKMIMKGAKLIATNLDPNCPVVDGIRPGCGAIVAMLETATGKKAFSMGKPSPIMFREARKELGVRTENTFMIGDTMETDIIGGVEMGYKSILVLSGGTKKEDLNNFAYHPDKVIPSIYSLMDLPELN
ncbi:HAD-IIA family hydrolase [Flavivirga jejuensis]|uniref:HAD-IIA family hydrolase n=1 Tax=Flavivirga jejuensis TaxID=870487 RepID=A0ABT8WHT5_9FLAO|nr:HAD-IIA family hydrolase [Flavivirga jejuensis]MDO5972638.1 HAD-IIA family hydrolase [Flavivirga jejuensis]